MIGRPLDHRATTARHDALKVGMDCHVIGAHDIGRRFGVPRSNLRLSLQGDSGLRTEAPYRPIDGVGVAVVVEAFSCARRVEGDHVTGTHDETGPQVRSTFVRDPAGFDLGGGGTDARFADLKGEGGDIDQMLNRRMKPRLGDDGSPIGVSDKHDVTAKLVKPFPHPRRRQSAGRRKGHRPPRVRVDREQCTQLPPTRARGPLAAMPMRRATPHGPRRSVVSFSKPRSTSVPHRQLFSRRVVVPGFVPDRRWLEQPTFDVNHRNPRQNPHRNRGRTASALVCRRSPHQGTRFRRRDATTRSAPSNGRSPPTRSEEPVRPEDVLAFLGKLHLRPCLPVENGCTDLE